MDQAGIILGGTSLVIQVLSGCIKGYATFELALDMPDEFGYLSVQLEIEHNRLRDFSQAAGLFSADGGENGHAGLQGKEQVLLSILREIRNVLDTLHYESKAPLLSESSVVHKHDRLENIGEAYQTIANDTATPKEPPMGVLRRLKWGMSDKEEFVKLLQRLRRCNDFLHELLDSHQTRTLKAIQHETNMQLVQARNSIGELKALVEASKMSRQALDQSARWQQNIGSELESLAIFKTLYASLLEGQRTSVKHLRIDSSHVQLANEEEMGKQLPQAIYRADESMQRHVWINWQQLTTYSPPTDETSLTLIEELTILLMAPKPAEFCVFPCLGYGKFTVHGEQRLGLIFENPPEIDSQVAPSNLKDLIAVTPKPSLTSRIKLAYKIAQCLLYLHCVNWLHKDLRSENILVLPSAAGSNPNFDWGSPYVTGFDHSRRARFNEPTTETPRDGSMEAYRHPDIQMNGPRLYYRRTFDIYSLGIILIEIGHWKSIKSIMGIEDTIEVYPKATSEIQSRWLQAEPALQDCLRGEVGDRYTSAATTCIAGRDSFGIGRKDLETSADTSLMIQQGFNALVVNTLRQIDA